MTLLNIEGFEARSPRMGWIHSNFSTAGRFGGICAHSGEPQYALPYSAAEVVVGWAMKVVGGSAMEIFRIYQKGTTNGRESMRLQIRVDRSFSIHKYDPNSSIDQTPLMIGATPVGDAGQWIYVEVRARIAQVGGYYDVRVNGAPYLSYVGNTVPSSFGSADSNVSMVQWMNVNSNHQVDDIYICDRLGSEFNDFLGEVQVEGLFPNGNGASSQWVGSDGNSTDNYLLVDEAPAVETDLVQSDVVGAKDTYQFANLAIAQGQILAVQPTIYLSKANAGPASAKVVERLANGTERKSAAFVASNLMPYSPLPATRDPESGIWTTASVNAAEFGVEVA